MDARSRPGARVLVPLVAALLVTGVGLGDLVQHYAGEVPPLALSLARAVPLLLVLRAPRACWALVTGACVLTALLTTPVSPAEPWPWPVSSVLAVAVAVAGVGLGGPRPAAVAATALTIAAGGVLVLADPAAGPVAAGATDLVGVTVLAATGALVGDLARGRRETAGALAAAHDRSLAEVERRRAVEERARIARELHDVVAHHLSLIAVQAASAPVRVDDLDEAGREFTSIAGSAREGLDEMRRLLAVLRPATPIDTATDAGRAPAPGLAELDGLVARAGDAGLRVRAHVDVDAGLPPTVELDAYRIVQEALSNVVRHAPGARAVVDVAVPPGGRALVVEVRDDGPGVGGVPAAPAVPAPPGGSGLLGMRERVRVHGGTLDAGPRDTGGFRVRAHLPLPGGTE